MTYRLSHHTHTRILSKVNVRAACRGESPEASLHAGEDPNNEAWYGLSCFLHAPTSRTWSQIIPSEDFEGEWGEPGQNREREQKLTLTLAWIKYMCLVVCIILIRVQMTFCLGWRLHEFSHHSHLEKKKQRKDPVNVTKRYLAGRAWVSDNSYPITTVSSFIAAGRPSQPWHDITNAQPFTGEKEKTLNGRVSSFHIGLQPAAHEPKMCVRVIVLKLKATQPCECLAVWEHSLEQTVRTRIKVLLWSLNCPLY